MKLYLSINPASNRNGYTNVNTKFENLDAHVEHGEAEEIVVSDALEYVPSPAANAAMLNWLAKLAHGGRISIEATDLRQVFRAFVDQKLDLDGVNRLLYGDQTNELNAKKVGVCMNDILRIFAAHGLQITKKRLTEYGFVVEGVRP